MSAHAWDVQRAIYNALLTDPKVAAGKVYDHVPQDTSTTKTAYPHVIIGERQIIPDDTNLGAQGEPGDSGVQDFFDLHIWSRYRGDKEVVEILDAIHTKLHNVSLNVGASRPSANSWVRNFRSFDDPDGVSRHGVVTIEVVHRS